ncbi:hypothetical protein GCM10022221_69230 [Actinocorallia aurea]
MYAENPAKDHRPSAGLLTEVVFPADVRVDGWIETGTVVTSNYDPLLAKVITHADDREAALERLGAALGGSRVGGIETNLGLLRAIVRDARVGAGEHSTATLASITDPEPRVEVLRAGVLTTVQDWPGRTGYWQVGVPPSGPMDDRSLRRGNLALGNPEGAPGLECTLQGPSLRFTHATDVCVTGAPAPVTVDDAPAPHGVPFTVPAGSVLDIGTPPTGLRTYVTFAGGLDVPRYLGSASTFTLGGFGQDGGRAGLHHLGGSTDGTPSPPMASSDPSGSRSARSTRGCAAAG